MIRLAVRLHRRHGWLTAAALYLFLAAASVLTGGLSVAVLIVGGKAKRRWAAGRAAA